MPTGKRIEALVGKAGQNTVEHVPFANVRRPAELSKLVGIDVRGFKHAVSNQAIQHARRRHPNLEPNDFAKLPVITKAPVRLGSDHGGNGEPRIVYEAQIDGVRYGYVAEVRKSKRRIDAITLYRI